MSVLGVAVMDVAGVGVAVVSVAAVGVPREMRNVETVGLFYVFIIDESFLLVVVLINGLLIYDRS